jgi:DNA-binding MarR family transcriptional regulator
MRSMSGLTPAPAGDVEGSRDVGDRGDIAAVGDEGDIAAVGDEGNIAAVGDGGDLGGRGAACPSGEALDVWRSFLRANAVLMRALEAELAEAGHISLAQYDVLVQLTETPCGRLRMTELADRVLLSRSGITRLVDRLESEGLVRRERCPNDARGTFAVVTDLGVDRLREAAQVHLPGVGRHFTSRFTAQELRRLGQLLYRLS